MGEQRRCKADHSCRGSLCVPSPAPRTHSQIAAGSRMQEDLGSEWRKLETHQARVEEGWCPGQRTGNVPRAALPSASEMGTASVPPALLPCPFHQRPPGLSAALAHTQMGQMASTEGSSPCCCPSPPEQTQISLREPGHSLSGSFPAPHLPARIWPEAQLHSFTWKRSRLSEEVSGGCCHCPFYLGLFRIVF